MNQLRSTMLLILLTFVGGGIRLGWVWNHTSSLQIDTDGYLDIGRHLLRGEGFAAGTPAFLTAYRPPLYPLVVAAALATPGELWTLAILQVLSGTLTIYLVGRIVRRLGISTPWSLIAVAILALDPLLIHVTSTAMTESLCTLLVALWANSIVNSENEPIHRGWITGFWLGLLTLCRPTFLPLCLLQFPVLACFLWRDRANIVTGHPERKNLWKQTGIQCLCVGLCLLPWTLRNGLVIGKFTPTTTHGGYTLLLANNSTFYREVLHAPWGTSWAGPSLISWQGELEQEIAQDLPDHRSEPARDRWHYQKAFQTIREQPRDFIASCFWRFARLWDPLPQYPLRGSLPMWTRWGMMLWYPCLWIAASVGCLIVIRRKSWPGILMVLMIANICAVHFFYWTDLRMRAPLMPLIGVLAAIGSQWALGGIGAYRNSPAESD